MRVAYLSLLLLGACALRPRYEELATRLAAEQEPRSEVLVQVLDRDDAPVPGARIEIGERHRFRAVADQNGVFRLPLDKKLAEENALVVVLLPKGVRGYKLVAPGGPAPVLPALPLPAEADGIDAGVTTM